MGCWVVLSPQLWSQGSGWDLDGGGIWVGVFEVCGAMRGYRHHGALEPTAMGTTLCHPPPHRAVCNECATSVCAMCVRNECAMSVQRVCEQ